MSPESEQSPQSEFLTPDTLGLVMRYYLITLFMQNNPQALESRNSYITQRKQHFHEFGTPMINRVLIDLAEDQAKFLGIETDLTIELETDLEIVADPQDPTKHAARVVDGYIIRVYHPLNEEDGRKWYIDDELRIAWSPDESSANHLHSDILQQYDTEEAFMWYDDINTELLQDFTDEEKEKMAHRRAPLDDKYDNSHYAQEWIQGLLHAIAKATHTEETLRQIEKIIYQKPSSTENEE